ncbi:MAG: hypothetical protein J6Z47_06415 [Bacteroidales bacterium]|nr:hypothetical protein [Bacteroidales bacterium]
MKRFLILCGLVAALMCLAQNANAQYARKGANIVDPQGKVLSDKALVDLVGNDIYEQTVIGARKQFKAGKKLIAGGIVGIGVGFAGIVAAAVKMQDAGYEGDWEAAMENDPSVAGLYLLGAGATSLGCSAVSAGIVLKTIGKKRLNWVAGQCGVGIALNF